MSDYSILPEHAAPESTKEPEGSYTPTTDEKKSIKYVNKRFEKAKKIKSQYDYKWPEYYRMFRGKQWREQRPSYRHSEVLNLLFQTIQSQVPIITDIRPKFEFLPQEPKDYQLSEILNDVASADWTKNNWGYKETEMIYEGHFYGTGMSYLGYDADKREICYQSSDPFYCFPDPEARDVNDNAEYFIYAEPMTTDRIKRKWPEKGKFVKPDLVDLTDGAKTDLGPIRFKSPTDNKTIIEGAAPPDVYGDLKDKALVITLYCKSEEYEEIDPSQTDPSGYQDPTLDGPDNEMPQQKLKYPNGKKIVVANNVLLEEGPNPYDHGEFPYQRWQNYILPREFWGVSEIEQLEGPQRTFNKIISFVLDVMTLMGNPVWVVDNTSDVDTDNLVSRPGLVIEKNPNSQVTRMEGTQLQPYILQMIDRYKEWFDQIAGSNDVTRGLNPSGVTAAAAIADLQNAAQTRIRQKSRNLDAYLQQLGQQYLSLVFQFYTAPKIFRLTGKDGAEKYFKFHVSSDEATGMFAVNVEKFTPEGLSTGIDQYQTEAKFDVRVTTGSALPFSKAEKEQQLLNLYDRQIIDTQEVLKGLDYPNYEALLQRMEAKQAQQAQMQAQQGAKPA